MIDHQHGKILVECDSCDEVISSEEGEEWPDFWRRAKRDGWRTRQIDNEWLHGCPRHGVPK